MRNRYRYKWLKKFKNVAILKIDESSNAQKKYGKSGVKSSVLCTRSDRPIDATAASYGGQSSRRISVAREGLARKVHRPSGGGGLAYRPERDRRKGGGKAAGCGEAKRSLAGKRLPGGQRLLAGGKRLAHACASFDFLRPGPSLTSPHPHGEHSL